MKLKNNLAVITAFKGSIGNAKENQVDEIDNNPQFAASRVATMKTIHN